ncbi:MAG: glycosyltransferase family 2 protein [Clostridia bacterium]|nr:glycosyltransferase family 2 protein [Clostridia bacterium]
MSKLISIIVPVYKVEQYLDRCITSILNQTHTNIEVILVDDGSPDNSGAICDKYAKLDSRVKVIHKENGGVSSARNLGLELAKGEYFGFIDSDDYIEPNMYESLYAEIEKSGADMAVCGFKQVRVNGDSKVNDADDSVDFSKENIIKNYFTEGIIKELMYAPVNKLYKKETFILLRFDTKYALGEDILYLLSCIEKSNKITYVKGAFYNYIIRENSAMTSSFSLKRLDYIYAIREIEKTCENSYSYATQSVKTWVYRHVLNTVRQLIVNNKIKQCSAFYLENKKYLKENKAKYLKKLSLNQKIDYFLIMYCHLLLKLKVKLS